MKLNYKELGNPKSQPLLILHGVFGSLDNWLTLGRQFAETYRVFLIDQRNHGRSPHDSTMNYTALADDLHNFIEEHQLKNPLLIGHSMGGKVVMQYALNYPDTFEKMVIVDISPRKYNVSHHEAILNGLKAIDVEKLENRSDADEVLGQYIDEEDVRMFLLKNLARTKEGFEWKMNLPVLEKSITKIGGAVTKNKNIDTAIDYNEKPTLFINGGQSRYIQEKDISTITKYFPNAHIHTIHDAGHWVHAQSPKEFFDVVMKFLKN
ncbi:putative hydrolase or acyltransferase of alpha/beta superfamily [Bernardetia litoralis DSM 6794]|uniref:Putative hydrolase or acyltransferase of alpha/beta superfamily n=1 Tax=Bernardetia litoralis (strain ATCC 23117 / DSM 6794 / NBRC 15988 / NCIMB 1366 / Fx l1 / Sio-4) TaxID=880071 RepID=I4AJF1_BERLS|nr:alpha/beta fold hydrolase [Bernardetia litoralis]AFM04086.1 putative hydrolase or acyltransferase of alpha/beta superfamily [Bernardetia litoralis DSM 6794]